jgi:hypothetical protein
MPPTFLLLDARSPVEIEHCRKNLLSELFRAFFTTPPMALLQFHQSHIPLKMFTIQAQLKSGQKIRRLVGMSRQSDGLKTALLGLLRAPASAPGRIKTTGRQ